MSPEEQFDFIHGMQVSGELDREERIRTLAVEAAEKASRANHYTVIFAWSSPSAYQQFYSRDRLPATSTVMFKNVKVNIHPGLRGFERVLVAEKQIRAQV